MKIIYLSRWYPYPVDNGSRLRIYHTLKQLGSQHEVHLISFSDREVSPAEKAPLLEFCATVTTTPWREFNPSSARALAGFFSSRPRSFVDTYSPEMQALVSATSAAVQPDAIIASQSATMPYVMEIQGPVRILEELELGLLFSGDGADAGLLRNIRTALSQRKTSRYYSRMLNRLDGYTVVSKEEQALVAALLKTNTPMRVIPNGMEFPAESGAGVAPNPNRLVYLGSPTYHPNLDAVAWFVEEVLPALVQVRPEVELHVTGALPKDLQSLPRLGKHVIYTGVLPSVYPLLAGSWASVVPLRLGGGTRLKVLESIGAGTAVIATDKGAEGLALAPGVHYLQANTPTEWIDATLRLMEDRTLRDTLVQQARCEAERRFQWSTIVPQLAAFVEERIQSRTT